MTSLDALDSPAQELSSGICFVFLRAVPYFLELFCQQRSGNSVDDALNRADDEVPMVHGRRLWMRWINPYKTAMMARVSSSRATAMIIECTTKITIKCSGSQQKSTYLFRRCPSRLEPLCLQGKAR